MEHLGSSKVHLSLRTDAVIGRRAEIIIGAVVFIPRTDAFVRPFVCLVDQFGGVHGHRREKLPLGTKLFDKEERIGTQEYVYWKQENVRAQVGDGRDTQSATEEHRHQEADREGDYLLKQNVQHKGADVAG